jgi:phospholipase/carboxylesterase/glyoxalase family protein
MTTDLGFVYIFQPAQNPGAPTLLLLHGTGGDEHDMLPLGGLAPGAALLSPRGKVLENGMLRFFRRLSEGVFDVEDMKVRANELADFVIAAAAHYRFDPSRVIAMGFSNGANIASAMMLLRPRVLKGAILFRGMVPLVPESRQEPPLAGTKVLISNGRIDPTVPPEETERLARLLEQAGADVEVHWQPAGHQLMPSDFAVAKTWLQSIR